MWSLLLVPLLLLLLPSTCVGLEVFGQGVRSDGGDALFQKNESNHQWCCTDAACIDSCNYFDPPMDPSHPFLLLPQGTPPTSNELWTYGGRSYTIWEVYINRHGIAAPFCEELFGYTCAKGGGVVKDPHFQLWNQEWYDFHGECDLVFLKAPKFGKDVGLAIHIRTRMRHGYSYIETAVMKIGNDILQVSSWGQYMLNGVEGADLEGAHLGPFDLVHTTPQDNQHAFTIVTPEHPQQVIQIKTFKDFVDVKLEHVHMQDFVQSQGMMGEYPTGKKLARDGNTTLEDPNLFGMEWQVRVDQDDNDLFSYTRYPQHPIQCLLPATDQRRRLGEKGVSREQAETACAHIADQQQREMCIFDVVATGDLDMAAASVY